MPFAPSIIRQTDHLPENIMQRSLPGDILICIAAHLSDDKLQALLAVHPAFCHLAMRARATRPCSSPTPIRTTLGGRTSSSSYAQPFLTNAFPRLGYFVGAPGFRSSAPAARSRAILAVASAHTQGLGPVCCTAGPGLPHQNTLSGAHLFMRLTSASCQGVELYIHTTRLRQTLCSLD